MAKTHTDPLTPSRKGGPFSFWTSLKLWQKILIALVLGVVTGAILGPQAEYIKPIGSLFINLIKMLIVPLIFSSLVVGICSMDDIKKMGRIGAKSFGVYLLTTAIAITIGLVIGTLLQPGAGLNMELPAEMAAAKEAPSFVQTLLNMVPKNPVAAMSSGSVLQIIVFALMLGVAINLAGEKGKPVAVVFESFAEIMY
jgi:Na+/H+-dicarboxylate symporter